MCYTNEQSRLNQLEPACQHARSFNTCSLSLCSGGALSVLSGRSTVNTGGSAAHLAWRAESGEGTATKSGVIAIRGRERGRLVFSSGSSQTGNSGALFLGSGVATAGRGGMVTFSVGGGTSG